MAIIQKLSLTSGSIPTTSSLQAGELAINVPDGRLFLRKSGSGSDTIESAIITEAQNIGNIYLTGTLDIFGSGSGIVLQGEYFDVDGDLMEFTGSFIVTGSSTVTGSLSVTNGITGSLQGTSSWATNALTASSADNFTVRNTLTATTIVVQTITSSIDFVTGSTRFGSLISNTHQFTGSVGITGSLTVVGAVSASNFTGSLLGTSSYASNADLLDGAHLSILATTGSNTFIGNQTVTGSLTISGSLGLSRISNGSILFVSGATNGVVSQSSSDLYWDYTNRRLGIGTTSPNASAIIHVNRSQDLPSSIFVSNANTGPSVQAGIRVGLSDTNYNVDYLSLSILGPNFGTIGVLQAKTGLLETYGSNFVISNYNNTDPIIFATSTARTEKVRITAGGQMGIGVTSPAAGTSLHAALIISASAVQATSFTGSLLGTASYATQALSASWAPSVGGSSITIADESVTQGTATYLNFLGAGVTATVTSNTASITISGGGGGGSAFPFTGSAVITGSLVVTGSFDLGIAEFNSTSSATTAGTTIVSSYATASYNSAFYNYYISSGSNARAGQIMSVWSGSTINYTEVTTTDLGNTNTASFAVTLATGNVRLSFTAPGVWTVRSIVNLL